MTNEQYEVAIDNFRISLKTFIEKNYPQYINEIGKQAEGVDDMYQIYKIPVVKADNTKNLPIGIKEEIRRLSDIIFNDFVKD